MDQSGESFHKKKAVWMDGQVALGKTGTRNGKKEQWKRRRSPGVLK
jgi:hypothetical protein